MLISIVIPLLNEAESLPELHTWIKRVMDHNNFSYEVIFIDDGSSDNSWEIIKNLKNNHSEIKAIRFSKNYGKSQALHAGFDMADGDIVFTMDADLQDSPDEIPEMIEILKTKNLDLLSGWKKKRYDSVIFKNLPSKLFNYVARKTSGLKLHDFNCGLKAYRKDVVKSIDVKGEMHRYIPVLAKNEGFKHIDEKPVKHQARKFGQTKFGAERFINGFLDLVSLWFFSKFGKRPMHFFGALGVLMFVIGLLSSIYIGGSKLYKLYNDLPNILVVDNPFFYIALSSMIIGVQLFLAGFIAELLLNNQSSKYRYNISEKI
ncbi:glycosyltransferase family 2 protein [Flavobacterium sp. CS20]|jgi:glycosyltransferase involved in cell wall biosynthesis|uniref:glycosyltransferase family 2 protein n=1 Tax=Flavobacterium sp. CS20 TaxID=2775246 RepID=UPI001B3A63A6|nr:glycosyltransferase family 2 protein [Flavobacterium sp. CS20]QTY25842.1 glycosyltransferase [Flavobacterium sp. CS20]